MTTKTIPLRHPFEIAGKTFTEVVFRRPKARDMALLARLEEIERTKVEGGEPSPADQAEGVTLLLRAVSGLPQEVIEEIDLLEDIPTLSEEAAGFLEGIAPPAQASGGQ
jgi:hypothetical protein